MSEKQRVCVIGLGEIGSAVYREMRATDKFHMIGVDIDQSKFVPGLPGEGSYSAEPARADVYIVSVWTMDQIFSVLHRISRQNLIIIESTIDISRINELYEFASDNHMMNSLVTMPHRWNPGDKDHGVFNQNRVLGGFTEYATTKAYKFYRNFMDADKIHVTDFWTAAASKVCENAYRAMEIVLAQELLRSTHAVGQSFERLRAAMNTKWNIHVREARDGVRGKCLPKDLGFFCNAFPDNMPGRILRMLNEEYMKNPYVSSPSAPPTHS